ncbi:MAG: hypothetical protein K5643_05095 [Saccharofermentans sp.]|nr:hypothetical protein [Saccharofermentans sp.]
MENDYVEYFYRVQQEKIPKIFRVGQNTKSIVKWSVISVMFFACVMGFFLCLGGRGTGEIETENLMGSYTLVYPQLSLTIIICAFVLIALILLWVYIANFFQKRAFERAVELARPIMEKDRSRGDPTASWNRDRYMRELNPVMSRDLHEEDELDLSDIKIENM